MVRVELRRRHKRVDEQLWQARANHGILIKHDDTAQNHDERHEETPHDMLVAKTSKRRSNYADKHHRRQQAHGDFRSVHNVHATPKRQVAEGTRDRIHDGQQYKQHEDRRLIGRG